MHDFSQMNDDAPKLKYLSRSLRFHILKKALGMSNAEIAKALGKSYKTFEVDLVA